MTGCFTAKSPVTAPFTPVTNEPENFLGACTELLGDGAPHDVNLWAMGTLDNHYNDHFDSPADAQTEISPHFDKVQQEKRRLSKAQTNTLLLWHQRLGHRNFRDVAKLLNLPEPSDPPTCVTCIMSKGRRHAKGTKSSNKP